jgi:hydrogenase-4 membrane subunit HyfE
MTTWLYDLNALVLGLFVLCAIGMAVMRQVGACLQVFVIQSLLLAASAFLLGGSPWSWHLFALGCVTVASKAVLIPWILRALVPGEVYARRELSQAIGVPAILLATLALVLAGYAFARHSTQRRPVSQLRTSRSGLQASSSRSCRSRCAVKRFRRCSESWRWRTAPF